MRLLFTPILALSLAACAQPVEETETEHSEVSAVREAIDQVFEGMRTKDSGMVSARLAEGVVLHRAEEQDGVPVLTASEAQGWLNSIAQDREEILDERIWDVEIEVDGRLATAWMKFTFFFGGEFSHCGVNAMMLFKDVDGWKIFALADTSRRGEENCWMPPDQATVPAPIRHSRRASIHEAHLDTPIRLSYNLRRLVYPDQFVACG